MPMAPAELLAAGRAVLDSILLPAGFVFVAGAQGPSCGGDFVQAAYVATSRRVQFSVRHELGLVEYVFRDVALSHDEFMRAALSGGRGAWPGFDADPRGAFARLAKDLAGPASPFVRGDEVRFRELARWAREHPRPQGMGAVDVAADGPKR